MVQAQRKILKILSKPRIKPCYSRPTNHKTESNNHVYSFFNYLYKETSFSSNNLETCPKISFPKFTKEKSKTVDGGITEKELLFWITKYGK